MKNKFERFLKNANMPIFIGMVFSVGAMSLFTLSMAVGRRGGRRAEIYATTGGMSCSVSVSQDQDRVYVDYNGVGIDPSNRVRLWINREDGKDFNYEGSNMIRRYEMNNGVIAYQISEDTASAGELGGKTEYIKYRSLTKGGKYIIHCDVLGDSESNMCSGNPFCDYNGGNDDCSVRGWTHCGPKDSAEFDVGTTPNSVVLSCNDKVHDCRDESYRCVEGLECVLTNNVGYRCRNPQCPYDPDCECSEPVSPTPPTQSDPTDSAEIDGISCLDISNSSKVKQGESLHAVCRGKSGTDPQYHVKKILFRIVESGKVYPNDFNDGVNGYGVHKILEAGDLTDLGNGVYEARWNPQIRDDLLPGKYKVECKVCSNSRCTEWGKAFKTKSK